MTPALIAFATVFVAELGDKTQLIALGLGARHRLWVVAVGLVIGYGLSNLVAAAAGGLIGRNLPTSWVGVASGGAFVVFAALSARRIGAVPDVDPEDGTLGAQPAAAIGSTLVVTAIAGIASAIVIGELGDKTQLATAALAANGQAVLTWVGATAGVTSAGLIGAVAGSRLARRLTPRRIVALSTALFAGFGLLILVGAVVADDW
ncbi:MAG: TMEM165/GDT1 family protein [Ilumatobacteraceae bacterium]